MWHTMRVWGWSKVAHKGSAGLERRGKQREVQQRKASAGQEGHAGHTHTWGIKEAWADLLPLTATLQRPFESQETWRERHRQHLRLGTSWAARAA